MMISVAGKSRSATIVAAYLMQRLNIGVAEALEMIQKVRDVDPNTGFREQLQVYLDCNFVPDKSKAAYRHWRLRQETQLQKGTPSGLSGLIEGVTGKYGKPDNVNYVTASAVVPDPSGTPVIDLRCKKCRYSVPEVTAYRRRVLASSASFLIHKPPEELYMHQKSSYAQVASTPRAQVDSILAAQCAHFFLEPQDWMQSSIDQGELDGKLECPKCSSKVGGYAWQGMKCSCGMWVTPCFSLGKSKVDEVRRINVNATNGVMRPKAVNGDTVKSKV